MHIRGAIFEKSCFELVRAPQETADALELAWFKEGSIRVLFIKMWVLYRGTIKGTSGTEDFSADTYKDVTTAWPEGRWESPYWDPEGESFVEMVSFGWGSHPARGKLAGREIRKEIPWPLLLNFLSDLLAKVFMSQTQWTVKDKEDIDSVYRNQALKAESRMESRLGRTEGSYPGAPALLVRNLFNVGCSSRRLQSHLIAWARPPTL